MSSRAASASSTGGTLFIVATPIGNLGDVTFRSLEILRTVLLVAAEDTRVARKLFARHGIATPLVSYHARNAAAREGELLGHLAAGRASHVCGCASVKNGNSGERRYGRYKSGLAARPFMIVMKWSWGPVVNPVMPMYPMT